MNDPIYILGHKNPDADAICSAIAYEAYKHAIGETEYVAARCGNSNPRIEAILERFKMPLPPFIGDVTPRVESIMKREIRTVNRHNTCAEALEIIDAHDVRALPVVDSDGKIEGTLSVFQLGEFFIPKSGASKEMRRVSTTIEAIVRSLDAKVLHMERPEECGDLYIRVGAMDIRSFGQATQQEGIDPAQSIIVVGDRWDIQERSIQLGVRLLVITGDLEVDPEVLARAKEKGVSLIVSPFDSASTALSIRTATRIDRLIDEKVITFSAEDKVKSVKRRIANLSDPLFMVVNEEKQLVGVFSKGDILRPSTTRIALVDHNEISQAVNGASLVQITEIIDHHRLSNTPTDQPILFINRPVGSTSSIIADLFRGRNIKPQPQIAGILMAGIISDTLHLNSPTTTDLEGELLDWLSPIAGVSSEELAQIIFAAGSVIVSNPPDEVIRSDCKVYDEGETVYSVSQIEELGFDNFWGKSEALSEALESHRKAEGLLFSLLLVTDINTQNSLLVVAGSDELRSQINYPQNRAENIYDLPGIVSRKKQLIPYVASLLKAIGAVA